MQENYRVPKKVKTFAFSRRYIYCIYEKRETKKTDNIAWGSLQKIHLVIRINSARRNQ